MERIGIMGALDEEIELYLSKMERAGQKEYAGFVFYPGRLEGVQVVVVKSGVGKVNAGLCAQLLVDRFAITALIFTGVAGALNPQLDVTDIVISATSVQHDIDALALGYKRGHIPFSDLCAFEADAALVALAAASAKKSGLRASIGTILTGDQFIADPQQAAALREKLDGECVDMESAAAAHACVLNRIPHVIIRSISDRADHSAANRFAAVCKRAAKNSFLLVEGMLPKIREKDAGARLLKSGIRTIPHWPKNGVMFRDITTLLKNPEGFGEMVSALAQRYAGEKIDLVVGIEARGFIIGAALADRLGVGFVPIRKKGKLPGRTVSATYALEYGTDTMEVHADAIEKGSRVLLVDDLIATGGTALAACELVDRLEGRIVECCFVVDLPALGGKKKLEAKHKVFCLVEFGGE